MRDVFEVREHDAAGRRGELTVPRAGVTVETPALLPVVNPHVQTISPSELEREFGAEILITNSYILYGSDELREPALEQGLHDLLGFSGAIMTDSGSFQLAEYGDIDVTTEEILQFQYNIGTDIGTPVDIPTPPDASHEQAREDLETTTARLATAEAAETGEMLVSAPVQGSTHPDLREEAGRRAYESGLDVFPVGAAVPLLNSYRFGDMVDVLAAAKRGLGENAPVHLFGAGHPMMFALAVVAGADLFDSAAYALYARDERYLTVRGTQHLDELAYFPCSCPVCSQHTPDDLETADEKERHRLLAEHNLYVTFEEMRRVKQALRRGNLLELVEARARGHPAMLTGYRRLLDHAGQLEETDSVRKDAFFYLSRESARRPEVLRHQERLDRFDLSGSVLLTEAGHDDRFEQSWRVVPPFGPVPRELSDAYPLNAELPDTADRSAQEAASDGVRRLVEGNPDVEFTLRHRNWPGTALATLPDSVMTQNLEQHGE